MQTDRVEVQLHAFLAFILDEGLRSDWRSRHFYPSFWREWNPGSPIKVSVTSSPNWATTPLKWKSGNESCEIWGFRHEVYENCIILGYYAASSGNS